MNCRFCGSFVPDGNDSCPVCGRRPEEEPIGKLLSENMPNPVAAEEKREEATRKQRAAREDISGEKPMKLGGHIAAFIIGLIGVLYGLTHGVIDAIKTLAGGQLVDMPVAITAGVVIVLAIVCLIAFIRLIRGIVNNVRYNK